MRKGFPILVIVVILAAAVGIAWLVWSRPREPVYQGKRLSVWLQGNQTNRVQMTEAVRAIGTNSIPTLLRLLREDDSSLKPMLLKLLAKQKRFKIHYTPAAECNREGLAGFMILGASASNAVPELSRIYLRNISPESERTTAQSLAFIGPAASNAVPALLARISAMKVLTRTNETEFLCSIWALGRIHSQPETAVPALMELLQARDNVTRYQAALALGEFGPVAKPALPLMLKCYAESNKGTKSQIAAAIGGVDPEAAAKAGVK